MQRMSEFEWNEWKGIALLQRGWPQVFATWNPQFPRRAVVVTRPRDWYVETDPETIPTEAGTSTHAHHTTYTGIMARNLAAAYRPEGVP